MPMRRPGYEQPDEVRGHGRGIRGAARAKRGSLPRVERASRVAGRSRDDVPQLGAFRDADAAGRSGLGVPALAWSAWPGQGSRAARRLDHRAASGVAGAGASGGHRGGGPRDGPTAEDPSRSSATPPGASARPERDEGRSPGQPGSQEATAADGAGNLEGEDAPPLSWKKRNGIGCNVASLQSPEPACNARIDVHDNLATFASFTFIRVIPRVFRCTAGRG